MGEPANHVLHNQVAYTMFPGKCAATLKAGAHFVPLCYMYEASVVADHVIADMPGMVNPVDM
jgi:hypothetical protein